MCVSKFDSSTLLIWILLKWEIGEGCLWCMRKRNGDSARTFDISFVHSFELDNAIFYRWFFLFDVSVAVLSLSSHYFCCILSIVTEPTMNSTDQYVYFLIWSYKVNISRLQNDLNEIVTCFLSHTIYMDGLQQCIMHHYCSSTQKFLFSNTFVFVFSFSEF